MTELERLAAYNRAASPSMVKRVHEAIETRTPPGGQKMAFPVWVDDCLHHWVGVWDQMQSNGIQPSEKLKLIIDMLREAKARG